MNVLLTSAAAKLRLIDAFQKAATGYGGNVIAVDSNPACDAADFARNFRIIPQDDDVCFEQDFLRICDENAIGLIIPTRDTELQKLASMHKEFSKRRILLPLPEPELLNIVLDKVLFYEFCLKNDFPVYERHSPKEDAPWPMFVRPRHSSAGVGATAVNSYQDWLDKGYKTEDDVICQQLSQDKEYSIDVLMSFDSEPVYAVARERLIVAEGESIASLIIDNPKLCTMAKDLCAKLGLKGHNLVQAFCTDDNDIHIIEVNARYGGASMMSVAAGMNSPQWLLQISEAVQNQEGCAIKNLSRPTISYGAKYIRSETDPLSYSKVLK